MFQRNKVASHVVSPQQEQPSTHSERQWYCCSVPYVGAVLIFLVYTTLIIDLANTQHFSFPVITWSSKDSRSSMSFFSLSERENWKFSAELIQPHISDCIWYKTKPLRLVKLMMKVVMHVPQEMRPQTGLGRGCSQGRLCHSHRTCLSRQ